MLSKGFGGGERYFVDLAVALAGMGHVVQALCHHRFVARDRLEGVANLHVDTVSSRGMWDRLSVRRLVQRAARFRPDVVHSHMARGAWAGGKVVARLGVPLVATTHNYVDLKYYRRVSAFIATTRDQRRYLLEHGIPGDRVEHIPNFSSFPATGTAPGLGPGGLRFAAYGRMVEKKGFAVLLDAFARARTRGLAGATLILGGDGVERLRLERRVAELGLGDAVCFAGWIEDVAGFLLDADAFVLPSLDEPFGIVLLEAMACARPIVTTRAKGPLEVLDDDTAWFAEIGDPDGLAEAMLALDRDRAAARERALRACERYRREYHRDAVVPRIVATYGAVLGEPGASPASVS